MMSTTGHFKILIVIIIASNRDCCQCSSVQSSQARMDKSNWRLKLLDFPRPALYDSGLSNSLQVSVQVSQYQNASNATFNFKPPTSISCSELNYLLVLTTPEYLAPRLEGPFKSSECDGKLTIPVYHIRTDARYTAYVVAYNNSLSFKSNPLQFTTTGVAWATVLQGPNRMMITCHFTPNSETKGCLIQIKLVSSLAMESKKTIHVSRNINSQLASYCWTVPLNTYPHIVEVKDWKADGRTGALAITTYIEEKQLSPCYKDLDSMWKHAAHLVLFCMSAAFMVVGILLLCSGFFCRIAGLNKYLKRRGGSELEQEKES